MSKPVQVKFKTWFCTLEFARYGNGRTALRLLEEGDGGTVAVATVNDPQTALADDEVLVKTWSENEGMLEALEAAGVVRRTGRLVDLGRVSAPVVRLLVNPDGGKRDPLGLSWVKFSGTFPSIARLLSAIADGKGVDRESLLNRIDLTKVPASSTFRAEQFAQTLGAEDVETLASGEVSEMTDLMTRLGERDGASDLFGLLEQL